MISRVTGLQLQQIKSTTRSACKIMRRLFNIACHCHALNCLCFWELMFAPVENHATPCFYKIQNCFYREFPMSDLIRTCRTMTSCLQLPISEGAKEYFDSVQMHIWPCMPLNYAQSKQLVTFLDVRSPKICYNPIMIRALLHELWWPTSLPAKLDMQ